MNAEQQEKIAQFCGVTGETAERAKFFLDANNFEVGAAIEMFYSQGDESMQAEEQPVDNQPPPVSASAPQTAQPPVNQPATKSNKAAKKNKKFMTVSDYKNQESDDSDSEQQGFYAGGSQNSGNMILGPKKSMKDNVKNLFHSARKNGAMLEEEMDDEDDQQTGYFGGRGHRLGDSSSPTTEDSQPAQPLQSAVRRKPKMLRVKLTVWKNGFTVAKGEDEEGADQLRTIAENKEFLAHISAGRIPPELIPEDRNTMVDIKMEDHHDQDFVAPKKKFKAFTGQGCTLGSTPSTSSANQAASQGDSTSKPQEQVNIEVDPSKPKTKLQIRLADGSRIVQEFNHSHTVGDLRNLAESRSQGNFVYMTTFPRCELKDMSQTLAEAKLLNACVQQKKA